MGTERHGLMVGIQRFDNAFFFTLKIEGTLRHEDYDTIVPLLESAIQGIEDPHVRALIDISELTGWELQTAWDDLKLGFAHGGKFDRIAVLGDEKWHAYGVRIADWFTHAEMRYFHTGGEALDWLQED